MLWAELRVPDFLKQGLEKLGNLPEEAVEELLSLLRGEEAALSSVDISRRVASKTQEFEQKDVEEIVDALLSMYRARQEYGVSTDTLIRDMSSAEGLETSSEQLEERLAKFLDVESLMITAKAFNVMSSHEHVMLKAQVLTDMRPIFREEDAGPPAAAVITHMLKLTYRQDEGEREFFLAMDSEDVRKLREVLERADYKAQSLRSLLQQTEIPSLEVKSASANTND